jgi:hypothetical protein
MFSRWRAFWLKRDFEFMADCLGDSRCKTGYYIIVAEQPNATMLIG